MDRPRARMPAAKVTSVLIKVAMASHHMMDSQLRPVDMSGHVRAGSDARSTGTLDPWMPSFLGKKQRRS